LSRDALNGQPASLESIIGFFDYAGELDNSVHLTGLHSRLHFLPGLVSQSL
jgi:hypothetical protein